jgi:hypothetical protein
MVAGHYRKKKKTTYSNGMETRETATTIKSRMLNRLRQNDPQCNINPYDTI